MIKNLDKVRNKTTFIYFEKIIEFFKLINLRNRLFMNYNKHLFAILLSLIFFLFFL